MREQASVDGEADAAAIADLLAAALDHHRRGDLDAAERLYRRALAADPRQRGVTHSLAVLDNQRGRFERAARVLAEMVQAQPGAAAVWNDYGIALAGLGRGEEAQAAYRRALELTPDSLGAANNLGEALRLLGRPAEALPCFEQALAAQPDQSEVRANLAHTLVALDRHEDALVHYRVVVAERPRHAAALRGAGLALVALDRAEEAVEPLEAACAASPGDPQMRVELSRVFADLGQQEASLRAALEALALAPRRPDAHLCAGQALIQLSRPDEALASLDAALELQPDLAEAHHARGNVLQTLGRNAGARQAFEAALRGDPRRPQFHYSLAETGRFRPGDPRLPAMEALEPDMAGLDARAKTALHFALAKAYDDLGRHSRAFRHLAAGNALKRAGVEYREAATLAMFRRIAEVFTADLMAEKAGLGDRWAAPVFIVGMPRSGTTLIEQVLASHPQVFGAGELPHVRTLAAGLSWEDGRRAFPDIAPSLDATALARLGGVYADKVAPLASGAARITDKMPENFPFVGLIHLILPRARIIHAWRDPADTCLSCYFKLFGGDQSHTYDLAELGRYHRAYAALMDHWAGVIPPHALIRVSYEALVADFEPQVRRILAFCDLEWDERCRDFHKTERPVRTASVEQVRRPLYASSIGRWRPYRRLLAPLLAELDGG